MVKINKLHNKYTQKNLANKVKWFNSSVIVFALMYKRTEVSQISA